MVKVEGTSHRNLVVVHELRAVVQCPMGWKEIDNKGRRRVAVRVQYQLVITLYVVAALLQRRCHRGRVLRWWPLTVCHFVSVILVQSAYVLPNCLRIWTTNNALNLWSFE